VDTVAILAGRGIRGVALERLAVDTGVKIDLGVVVTDATVDFTEDFFVREVLDVGILVAIDTLQLAVDRPEKDGLIDEK
jgi:hypothetical protein